MDVTWRSLTSSHARLSWLRSHSHAFRRVFLASLALLIITSLPYLYGYLSTPSDKVYSGIIYNAHDTAQYLSWMRESGSRVFIDNRLTSEPNPEIYFNLHWWIAGRIAALSGISLIAAYHLMRIVSVPLFVAAIYWMCSLFVVDARRRLYTFAIVILGSGLGWLWTVDKFVRGLADIAFPIDVYTAPGNAFYTMLISPHLTLAAALTLFTLGLAYTGYLRNEMRFSIAAGLLGLFLGLGHIYDLVTVWGVLGLFGLAVTLRDGFARMPWKSLGIVVLLSAPAALYFGYVASTSNPIWQQALDQYDNLGVFTPDPLHLIILLGVRLLLALTMLRGTFPLKNQSNRALFIRVWMVAGLMMIYLPLKFRIMLLLGLELPLSILAVDALFSHVIPWLRKRVNITPRRVATVGALLFFVAIVPTNLYLYGWRVLELSRHDYPFYLYRDDVAALEWIDTNTAESEAVLSSFVIGHYVPGLTGNRTFLSNAVMTANFNQKFADVERFFDASTDDGWRATLLAYYDLRYLIHGEAERRVGDFDPGQSALFEEVFTTERTRVFAVRYDAMASIGQARETP